MGRTHHIQLLAGVCNVCNLFRRIHTAVEDDCMEMTKWLHRLKINPDWRAKQNLETQTEHPSAEEAKSSDSDILITELFQICCINSD